jgi:ankyrin repeat protein
VLCNVLPMIRAALLDAARKGNLQSVRLLIDHGVNPNADFSKEYITEGNDFMGVTFQGGASVIVAAAQSGNPDMIREILRYKPDINSRGLGGKTVLIALAQNFGEEGMLAECIRLLVQAGADVNARDNHGNTALHETYNSEIEEELLKLGADINARNKDGETPIFTTVDDSATAPYIEHGADLSIRNNKGQIVLEAAQGRGPLRQEALRRLEEHPVIDLYSV